MLGIRLKLLVVSILVSAAPAVAGSPAAGGHRAQCPHQQAEAAAVAQALRVAKGPTRVTLINRAPSERWTFGFDTAPRTLAP